MDSFQAYEQKYRSNVELMKNRKYSRQNKPADNSISSQNLTNSVINKIRKTPITNKTQINFKEILNKFNKAFPKAKESSTFSVRTIQTKFTVLDSRGFNDQFLEVDKEITKACNIHSKDPIVNKCVSNMKSVVDWYKTHKVQNEISKSTPNQVTPHHIQPKAIDNGIILNLKKCAYVTPQSRKFPPVPTHRIVHISSDDKFMISAQVIDLQSQEQQVVLLMKLNSLVELKVGDEINLNNLKVKQTFNGEGLDVFIAWEVIR